MEMTTGVETATHLAHCYQGEYATSCKYGEESCPARELSDYNQSRRQLHSAMTAITETRGEESAHSPLPEMQALTRDWTSLTRLEQIVRRHHIHDLSGIPNSEYTASWQDVKMLLNSFETLVEALEAVREISIGVEGAWQGRRLKQLLPAINAALTTAQAIRLEGGE